MTNDDKTPETKTPEAEESVNESNADDGQKKKPKPKKGSSLKRIFWYLVLVIIIATVAWIIVEKPYQQLDLDLSQSSQVKTEPQVDSKTVSETDNTINALEQNVNALRQQLEQLSTDVESNDDSQLATKFERKINQLETELSEQRRELNQLTRQLPQQQAQQITQWRLFEAKQTVSSAARLLWGSEDDAAALKLLQIADTQLAGIETGSAMQIRRLLAADIARVENVVNNQSDQLALSLSGLHQRIADLPNRVEDRQLTDQNQAGQVSSDASDWRNNLRANWDDFLNTFIRIQPSTTDAEPLLTATQRDAMTMRLDLLLTMAQNAAIKNNSTLWRRYIDNAIPLISELKGETEATKDVISRLRDLRNGQVGAAQVTTLESLDALSQTVSQGGLQ